MRSFCNILKVLTFTRVKMMDGRFRDNPGYSSGLLKMYIYGNARIRQVSDSMDRMLLRVTQGTKRVTKTIPSWPKLAPFTLFDRERKGYPYSREYPRLYRDGQMLMSIIKGGYGHIEQVWSRGFTLGAANTVAYVLQGEQQDDGSFKPVTWYNKGKVPPRPFFFIDTQMYFWMVKTIHLKILNGLRYGRSKLLGRM